MKRCVLGFLGFVAFILSFSSCATITGTAKYEALFQVPDHPHASIMVNGNYVGKGDGTISLKRRDANKLVVTIKEDNCREETTRFTKRSFRVGAYIGNLGFTAFSPIGFIVDFATGAVYKPNEKEEGVYEIDNTRFLYTVKYKAIPINSHKAKEDKDTFIQQDMSKSDQLRELKRLFDEGILTQDEYEKEKAKILGKNE